MGDSNNKQYSSDYEYDSERNPLTKEQSDYFKSSKVRNDNGNLLVCYHGTPNNGFKEFSSSDSKSQFGRYKFGKYNVNFFTTDKRSAISYTEIGVEKDDNVYACYINIVNPFIVDNKSTSEIKSSFNIKDDRIREKQIKLFDSIFNKWKNRKVSSHSKNFRLLNDDLHKLNLEMRKNDEWIDLYDLGSNSAFGSENNIAYYEDGGYIFGDDDYDELRETVIGEDEDYFLTTDDVVRYVLAMNEEDNTNYDGIIIEDIVDSKEMFANSGTDVITLKSSNQIKLISNDNPTSSNRIDEEVSSDTDNEGNELSENQIEFFNDSKVRDYQHRLLVCYHRSKADFKRFDIDKFGQTDDGDLGLGFYFAYKKYISDNYKGDYLYKCYLNIKNPYKIIRTTDYDNYYQLITKDYSKDFFIERLKSKGDEHELNVYLKFKDNPTNAPIYNSFIHTFEAHLLTPKEKQDAILKLGYDGIIDHTYHQICVFYPNQIKSIDNKNPSESERIDESVDGDIYYRGYDSRYGVFDSSSKHATLYTWLTDDLEYAKQYCIDNEYGKVAKVRVKCKDSEIGSTFDLDEFDDYYDLGDEAFKEEILDSGLKGYGFYANDDESYCICIAKSCCEVIDSDFEENIQGSSESVSMSLKTSDSEVLDEVYPHKGESKKDFISRFMSVTKKEYPDTKQRYAVALSYWDRRNESIEESFEKVDIDSIDSPLYVTDEVYKVINLCKRGGIAFRILIDSGKEKEQYVIADATSNATHENMALECSRKLLTLNDYRKTDIEDDQYLIFVPKGYNSDNITYGASLDVDMYFYEYVYDFGEFFARDEYAFADELFTKLGYPIREIAVDFNTKPKSIEMFDGVHEGQHMDYDEYFTKIDKKPDIIFSENNSDIIDSKLKDFESLDEEYIDEDKKIYTTTSAYDVKNRCQNSSIALRILYDKKLKRYFLCDADWMIHSEMAYEAIQSGYYAKIGITRTWEADEELDNHSIHFIYAPKDKADSTWGSNISEDGYEYQYVYDFGVLTSREDSLKSQLVKAFGKAEEVNVLDGWESDNTTPKIKNIVNESLLIEKTRRDLINKSKTADNYAQDNQMFGKNRYERRKHSHIYNSVKNFNRIDMDAFFKRDILTVGIDVKGETDDYVVTMRFQGALREIANEIKSNKGKLEFKLISRALSRAFNKDNVFVHCTCRDFKYRQSYAASKDGYATQYEPRPSNITNPNDTKGGGCKHILLVLSNLDWMMKVATVINNYIKYCQERMEKNYAEYIFPKLYGMKYDQAYQRDLFDNGWIPSDRATMNVVIDRATQGKDSKGRWVSGNKYAFQKNPNKQTQTDDDQDLLFWDEKDKSGNTRTAFRNTTQSGRDNYGKFIKGNVFGNKKSEPSNEILPLGDNEDESE